MIYLFDEHWGGRLRPFLGAFDNEEKAQEWIKENGYEYRYLAMYSLVKHVINEPSKAPITEDK